MILAWEKVSSQVTNIIRTEKVYTHNVQFQKIDKMDAHERFMTHYTAETWVLLRKVSAYDVALTTVVNSFNQIIQNFGQVSPDLSLMYIKTVHTVLCSFYQHKVTRNEITGAVIIKKLDYQFNSKSFENININDVQKALYDQELGAEISSLILDILVLQMTLYHDIPTILHNLEELRKLMSIDFLKEEEMKILHLKLLDCYMDGILLHQRSPGNIKVPYLTSTGKALLRDVTQWLKLKNWNCQLLTLLLPKLIVVLNQNESLTNTWETLLTIQDDPGETLSILCLTVDIWFPMESEYDKDLFDRIIEEQFWLFLLKGLCSSKTQERKHALYIIKSIVDFIEAHRILKLNYKEKNEILENTQALELGNYKEIRPLICTGTDSQKKLFKKNLKDFYSILETLEEKQESLVQPIFPLLRNLVDETFKQENRETGFHIAWIRSAFLRILQHDSNNVVKQGLLDILIVDLELYNDEILIQVLNALNTTFLYENDSGKEESTIIKKLTILLNYAETKSNDLVTRFIMKASSITWHPVPLFYIIHALSMVKRVNSIWKEVEFETVKSIAEIISTVDCPILRIGSQTELLEAVTHFATESLDLVAVANTLSVFSTNEALIRGQLTWKRISTWLSKVVTKDEALSFLKRICEEMTNETPCDNLGMKSFSLIIMLFHDGHLILDSKLCPSLAVLRSLLDCLCKADSRFSTTSELRNVSIELISHFLDFESSNDCILRELISDYADASLRFVFKNLRSASREILVHKIDTYVLVTQQLLTADSSIIAKGVVHDHIERFEIESLNIIEDGEYSNNIQRLFGIKILYACLKAQSMKFRNYKFIGSLNRAHKISMIQSPGQAGEGNITENENKILKEEIAAEYYKFVAEIFHEYVKDELADEWIPDIEWIEQVSYFIEVGRHDIFAPVVGILSQIFDKGAVRTSEIPKFKRILKLCWCSTIGNELVTQGIIDLIFSSVFFGCNETKELTLELTRDMVDKDVPGLKMILMKALKYVKYLSNFYDAIIACLLHGAISCHDEKIEFQARSYVLDSYQDVYPNYLSNMVVDTKVATRAHAITLLHKMITDDPAHAAALLPSIIAKLDENKNKTYLPNSQIHRTKNQIMQVLLLLQPILENHDVKTLHTLMCNDLSSPSNQFSVRIMQEWLLIRIYLESENLCVKIWDLFDQNQEKNVDSLCSALRVVYHVARLLTADFQPDFVNVAIQNLMPYCMTQQLIPRLYAQVIISKLYDLATKLSYSTITEGFGHFYMALKKSLKYENLEDNSVKLEADYFLTTFNPIEDYSLQTLFYDVQRLSDIPSEECISPQIFEKFGFKESNSHPLKLLSLNDNVSNASVFTHKLECPYETDSTDPFGNETDSSDEYYGMDSS